MKRAEAQLAYVESLRLLRNPAVWIALTLTAWQSAATAIDSANENTYLVLVGYSLLIPGFVMVAITILSVLRSRMSGTEELLSVVPVGPDRRSVGHGLTGLTGGLVGAVSIAAIYLAIRPRSTIGPGNGSIPRTVDLPRPNVAQLLQGPLAIVAVVAFAVMLVRWVPSWLVLVPLTFLVLQQGVFLGVWFAVPTGTGTWLFPLASGVVHGEWIGCVEGDFRCDLPVSGFDRVTPWWHVAYLIAISVAFAIAAVMRHRRDQKIWMAFALSLAVAVILAMVQIVVAVDFVDPVGR